MARSCRTGEWMPGWPNGRLRAGNGLVCIPAGASDSINIFCLIQKLRGGTNSGTGFCAQRPELGARTVKCHLGRVGYYD